MWEGGGGWVGSWVFVCVRMMYVRARVRERLCEEFIRNNFIRNNFIPWGPVRVSLPRQQRFTRVYVCLCVETHVYTASDDEYRTYTAWDLGFSYLLEGVSTGHTWLGHSVEVLRISRPYHAHAHLCFFFLANF
jgi:hypothetical protein